LYPSPVMAKYRAAAAASPLFCHLFAVAEITPRYKLPDPDRFRSDGAG